MKKITKYLASLVCLFMLSTLVSLPAFAEEVISATEADDITVEAVNTDDSDDEEDEGETESDDDSDDNEDEFDNEYEDLVDELEDADEDGAVEIVEDYEDSIENEIDDLEDNLDSNPTDAENIRKRIEHLKELRARIRAKAIVNNANLVERLNGAKNIRRVYEIRWGALTGHRSPCKGVARTDLVNALKEGELAEVCKVDSTEYSGKVSVDKGKLKIHREVLFEENDSVTEDSGSSIAFNSTIAGHWDGLIVEYIPEENDDSGKKVNITISIGDLEETYEGSEVLGRKKIGGEHMIEIKHLAQLLSGLTNANQDKLIENKIKVQNKVSLLREKLDELRLANKGGSGANELEDLIDEAGEYNFDEISSDEVQDEIEEALEGLDSASPAQLLSKASKLKARIATIKGKAKARKYAAKMIPFKDTDDSDWYTEYVSAVKAKGIISGYKDADGNELGEYRPANNITVAEILKIGLETADRGTAEGTPNLAAALNHWAKGYAKKAEELGLDIVDGDVDLNRPATRAEVVRMALEALGIEPDAVTSVDFSDVPVTHEHAAFVQYAKDLGVISGDSGASTFRPDAPINRAEAAKIANLILSIIIGGLDS